MSDNELQTIPYVLGNISNLQELDLSGNGIEKIGDEIGNFTKLISLDVSDNYIRDISAKIGNLTSLCYLLLAINQLETLPEEIWNLINLRYLSLDNNYLEDIPKEISNLINIGYLSLPGTGLHGNIPKAFCNLTNLYSLDLSDNFNMSGDIPVEFSKLQKLVTLKLAGTELCTSSPEIHDFLTEHCKDCEDMDLKCQEPEKPVSDSPVIWKITSSGDRQGAYKIGDTVSVSVTFTSPVSLEHGNLILTLETGETYRTVTISPFDLSDTVVGTYTVQEGDISDDLNVSSIRLSGGTLKDAEGSAVWTTDPGYAILALQVLAGMKPENISPDSVDFSGDGKIGIEDVLCILRSVVRQEYQEYTDIGYANLADMKNIVIDGAKPVLAVTQPETGSCVKTLDKIKGTVSDESGEYTVALKITEGTETVYDKEWLTAKGEQNWEFDTSEIAWTKNAAYTVTATATDYAGNTDTETVSFSYDKKSSSVTCELSAEQIIFGEHLTVSGRITPAENVTDQGVSIRLTSPRGSISRSTKANEDGYFKYDLQCDDFSELDSAGQWTVSAAWEGNMCLNEAESEPITLTTSKGASQVTLDLTSGAIKSDEKISVSGKFTPQPYCGGDIPIVSIMLLISGPYGNKTEIVTTDDNAGHFRLKDYTGLTALGDWTVQAVFNPTDAYHQSISDLMSVRVVESAGYAIIVQGKIGTGEGIESHKKTTDFVYKQMKDRGTQDDKSGDESVQDIRYFHYSDKESIPSKQAVKDAVTTWARDKMNTSPANLYIVMVDHGLENKFFIDQDNPQLSEQDKTITPAELGEWLDTLQIGLNAQAMNQKIVAILGFCHSGSFIENLSGFNRVIIASAATDESSYKGPLDQDNIREGEFFISEFFKKAAFGKTIRTCFEEAVALTEQFTSGTGGSTNAPPYYDTSLQHPLLDDNGDKTGTNNLSVSGRRRRTEQQTYHRRKQPDR
ncbi:MAG: hypothetical protein GY749_10845 [Desulfobacteraceae bacterium]|nr:hypothetical protein [Desulfobacteraceae bacterium]